MNASANQDAETKCRAASSGESPLRARGTYVTSPSETAFTDTMLAAAR